MAYAVAVVGTGRIGRALGSAFAVAGHDVVFASRSPAAGHEGPIPVRAIPAALESVDAVVLATPGPAVPALLQEHRPLLQGKAVVDATNTVGPGPMHHATAAAGLSYYRAFNTLGVENFENPTFEGKQADLFYSGPGSHQALVETLISAVGLRPIHVGDGEGAAELLDGVTRLWFALALQQGRGRHLAFRMLT